MVVVKIELIESVDSLNSRPYKIVRVHDNGTKHLLTTEMLRRPAVRTARRLAERADVPLSIYGRRLLKTKKRLIRR